MNFLECSKFRQNALRAALFAIFVWLALGIVFEEPALSFLAAVAAWALLVALLHYLPVLGRRRHAAVIEAELPLVLMNVSVELNLGLSFEEVLRHAAKGRGLIAKEFARVLREIEQRGATIQESLVHFSERVDSLEVKRAIALFVSVYEQGHGRSGDAVKMLARELLQKQRAQAKEFSGRLVVYSLLFVAVSAIVPALFQSFAIVGSMVLHFTLTPEQVFLLVVLGFPLIDLGALCYIKAKTPVFLRD